MQTKLLFFACVFLVIIILLALKRPLWQAILVGIVAGRIIRPSNSNLYDLCTDLLYWRSVQIDRNHRSWCTSGIQYTFWRGSAYDASDVHVPYGKSAFSDTYLCSNCGRSFWYFTRFSDPPYCSACTNLLCTGNFILQPVNSYLNSTAGFLQRNPASFYLFLIFSIKLLTKKAAISTATIVAPTGVEYKTEIRIPKMAQVTEITAEQMTTCLKFWKILIAERDGKIISAEIRSDPTRFIPITIMIAIITAIQRLYLSAFIPVAFAKVSSNVTAKMRL